MQQEEAEGEVQEICETSCPRNRSDCLVTVSCAAVLGNILPRLLAPNDSTVQEIGSGHAWTTTAVVPAKSFVVTHLPHCSEGPEELD
jgi:hypothetical protein